MDFVTKCPKISWKESLKILEYSRTLNEMSWQAYAMFLNLHLDCFKRIARPWNFRSNSTLEEWLIKIFCQHVDKNSLQNLFSLVILDQLHQGFLGSAVRQSLLDPSHTKFRSFMLWTRPVCPTSSPWRWPSWFSER